MFHDLQGTDQTLLFNRGIVYDLNSQVCFGCLLSLAFLGSPAATKECGFIRAASSGLKRDLYPLLWLIAALPLYCMQEVEHESVIPMINAASLFSDDVSNGECGNSPVSRWPGVNVG